VQWAWSQGIDERLIGFLRFKPELLFDFDPARTLAGDMAFPSPRSWEFAHRALQKFADRPRLLQPALTGCVGQAAGIECAAYLETLDKLPDIDAIVEGRQAGVPEAIDLQYAVAAALVGRALRAKGSADAPRVWGHVLDYAERLPTREMGVMLVADLHRSLGTALFAVPAFARWAGKAADVLLYD
jgi:hypothetical protein